MSHFVNYGCFEKISKWLVKQLTSDPILLLNLCVLVELVPEPHAQVKKIIHSSPQLLQLCLSVTYIRKIQDLLQPT